MVWVLVDTRLTVAPVSTPKEALNWLRLVEPRSALLYVVAPTLPTSVTVADPENAIGAMIETSAAFADEAAKVPSVKARASDSGLS